MISAAEAAGAAAFAPAAVAAASAASSSASDCPGVVIDTVVRCVPGCVFTCILRAGEVAVPQLAAHQQSCIAALQTSIDRDRKSMGERARLIQRLEQQKQQQQPPQQQRRGPPPMEDVGEEKKFEPVSPALIPVLPVAVAVAAAERAPAAASKASRKTFRKRPHLSPAPPATAPAASASVPGSSHAENKESADDAAARPAKAPRRTRSTEAPAAAAAAAAAVPHASQGASDPSPARPARSRSSLHASLAPSARRLPAPMSARRVPIVIQTSDDESDDDDEAEQEEEGEEEEDEASEYEDEEAQAAAAAAARIAVRWSTRACTRPASYAPPPARGPSSPAPSAPHAFPASDASHPMVASARLPSVHHASGADLEVFERAGFHYLSFEPLCQLMREQGLLPREPPQQQHDARTRGVSASAPALSAPLRWAHWFRDNSALSFPASSTVRSHDAVVLDDGAPYLSAHALAHLLRVLPHLSLDAKRERRDDIEELQALAEVVIHKEPMWGVAN